ncbi:7733_t:CDS:1 [Diversispora eburnea]|uniref:7733_t:CDS:1 n=2 Tax=Diversisporales TaxID=214509 RepID=A0A9N8W6X4_9GLOM|nr:7733_t:CDS:1 [Diversispora eburnea]CAG8808324.1 26516_t:CDS:1 [Dentiscutata erythropus]
MSNVALPILEAIQNLWTQTNEYLPNLNTHLIQLTQLFNSQIATLNTLNDYTLIIVLFAVSYVLFSICKMILRWVYGTVVGMIKFGLYITIVIALYWIYVSIDIEKGNEEIRRTQQKFVQGVKGAVRSGLNDL